MSVPEDELLPTYVRHIAAFEQIEKEGDARDLIQRARGGSEESGRRFVEGNLYRVIDLLPKGLVGSAAMQRIERGNQIIMGVLQDYEGPSPLQEIDQRVSNPQ